MINNQKAFFQTSKAFNAALANGDIDQNTIVFIKDIRSIWTHGVMFNGNGGGGSVNIDIDSILSTTSTNPVENRAIAAEFEKYLTKDEYDLIQNPVKMSVSVNPSVAEYGNDVTLSISWNITRKGVAQQAESIRVIVDGTTNNASGTTYSTTVSSVGTHSITVTAVVNGTTVSSSTSMQIVRPTYIGFSSASTASNVSLSNLTKSVVTQVSATKTLSNTVNGNYLWIVTPYILNTVATDQGFTYTVEMSKEGTIDGLNYYRSVQSIDVSNLTYYIK